MRIAIVGSRDFPNLDMVREYVRSLPSDTIIVSGGAKGVDKTAEETAEKCNLGTKVFLPNWELYGKQAGFVRNADIIKDADEVVAFHHDNSKGTAHSIRKAKEQDKKVIVFYPNGDVFMNAKYASMFTWVGP